MKRNRKTTQRKVRVKIQNKDDIKWTISNNTITADTYVEILNGRTYRK